MIEIVYKERKETEKKETGSIHLPKNIRQIGNPGEKKKIYVEDYVISFMNQMTTQNNTFFRAAVLLGYIKKTDTGTYIFVSGAVDASQIKKEGAEIKFTETIWTSLYDTIKNYFDHLEIVGWFLSMPGYSAEITDEMSQVHRENFAGADKIFHLYDPMEKEENLYSFEYGSLVKQSGYYIYFERNEPMQEYMISLRDTKEPEPIEEVKDDAIKHFREIIKERKEENHQKKMMHFMYATSTFLVMIVVAIGITMINNYDKMRQMQEALAQISNAVARQDDDTGWTLSEGQQDSKEDSSKGSSEDSEAIQVQTVSGQVEKKDTSKNQDVKNKDNDKKDKAQNQSNQSSETTQTSENKTENTPANNDQATNTTQNANKQTENTANTNNQTQNADTNNQATTASNANNQTANTQNQQPQKQPTTYVVAVGDTLASISIKFYGTKDMIANICAQNGIKNSDDIKAGQKLLLP